jgi:hypothetical protein
MFTFKLALEYARLQEEITGIPHYLFQSKARRCSVTGNVETLYNVGILAG